MTVAEGRLTIHHQSGLHARPAALFVRTAAGFSSAIRLTNLSRDRERTVDAKSIINVMTLGVEQEHDLLIQADGDDAEAAVAALVGLVESDFVEPSQPQPVDAVPATSPKSTES